MNVPNPEIQNLSLADLFEMWREFQQVKVELEQLKVKIKDKPLPDLGGYDFAVRVLEKTARPLKIATIRTYVCENKIPHAYRGRSVIFKKEDLERWDNLGRPNCVNFEISKETK